MLHWCLLVLIFNVVEAVIYDRLAFNASDINASFVLRHRTVYAGEFPCMDLNENGTRWLLQFATVLDNRHPNETLKIGAYHNTPARVDYNLTYPNSTIAVSGYFNLSCIRDSRCLQLNEPQFFACHIAGVSSNCSSVITNHAPCQWIDVTGLDILTEFTLSMRIQPGLLDHGVELLDTDTVYNFSIILQTIANREVTNPLRTVAAYSGFLLPPLVLLIVTWIYLCQRRNNIITTVTYKDIIVRKNQ